MKKDEDIKISYKRQGLQPGTQPARFEDLWGKLRQVSAVPAWEPRGRIEDSLAVYVSGVTYRLYVYDYVSRAWRYTALT